MVELVYFLCAATSVTCAILLLRSFSRTRIRLLLWSGLCFSAFAATNILLVLDLVVVESVDLSLYRSSLTFVGIAMLLYGLIWDTSS